MSAKGLIRLQYGKPVNRIGIVNYFVGIGVIAFIWLLFSLSLRGIALLPFAGPGISLILAPIPTIYCFRFIAHFCDEDRLSADLNAEARQECTGPRFAARTWAICKEILVWLAIYVVLLVTLLLPAGTGGGIAYRVLPVIAAS